MKSPALRPPLPPVLRPWVAVVAVLFLLGSQGILMVEHQHEDGVDQDCAPCHVAHVQGTVPQTPIAAPSLREVGDSVPCPVRSAVLAARTLLPCRGPPA
ncbi:MAG: hypothetical protein AAF604_11315 [Acidobacteriota bacterium]